MSALSNPSWAGFAVHSEEWSSLFFVDLCIDGHGSLVIFRSVSVRPQHLFDLYFDHDYLFKLPGRERDAQSSGQCSTSHHIR
jgi:hypothetical protein